MPATPVSRIILVLDIERFGDPTRDDQVRVRLRQVLRDGLTDALLGAGIPEERWSARSTGDGLLVLIDPSVETARAIRAMIEQLLPHLREHNRLSAPIARCRVRVVLHAGHALEDKDGVAGEEVNLAFRLLDSQALRDRLAAEMAPMVLAVSDYLYTHVVRHRHLGLDPEVFTEMTVVAKETTTRAWVYGRHAGGGERGDAEVGGERLGRPEADVLRSDKREAREAETHREATRDAAAEKSASHQTSEVASPSSQAAMTNPPHLDDGLADGGDGAGDDQEQPLDAAELYTRSGNVVSRPTQPSPPGQSAANPAPGWSGDTGPDVSKERLLRLLDEGAESARLDFKAMSDLSRKQDQVELAKDIGAMQADGGYIVIGADDHGRPTATFSVEQAKLFDESKLRQKLRKWIREPFNLRSAIHEHTGGLMALVYVAPSPTGCCIFQADGQYRRSDGKEEVVFRKGDMFVRHGTASERAQLYDVDRILARAKEQREALRRNRDEFQAPAGDAVRPRALRGEPVISARKGFAEVMAILRDILRWEFDIEESRAIPGAKLTRDLKLNECDVVEFIITAEEELGIDLQGPELASIPPASLNDLAMSLVARLQSVP